MYFIIAILLFYVTILFSFNNYTLFDYILKLKYIQFVIAVHLMDILYLFIISLTSIMMFLFITLKNVGI